MQIQDKVGQLPTTLVSERMQNWVPSTSLKEEGPTGLAGLRKLSVPPESALIQEPK